jgi:hypothetical protein
VATAMVETNGLPERPRRLRDDGSHAVRADPAAPKPAGCDDAGSMTTATVLDDSPPR